MSRSRRNTPITSICVVPDGTNARHRKVVNRTRRFAARALLRAGDFEALPNRYPENDRARPDDGRTYTPNPTYKTLLK